MYVTAGRLLGAFVLSVVSWAWTETTDAADDLARVARWAVIGLGVFVAFRLWQAYR